YHAKATRTERDLLSVSVCVCPWLVFTHVADDITQRVFRFLHPLRIVFQVRGAAAVGVERRREKRMRQSVFTRRPRARELRHVDRSVNVAVAATVAIHSAFTQHQNHAVEAWITIQHKISRYDQQTRTAVQRRVAVYERKLRVGRSAGVTAETRV